MHVNNFCHCTILYTINGLILKSKMRFIPSPVLDDYNTDYFVVFPILNIIIDQVPYKSIFVNKSCYFKTRNQKRK